MPRHVVGVGISRGYTYYERPVDWLELPEVEGGEQVVYILTAVWEHESNFVSFLCRGAYIVDWGDGVVEDYADNVVAYHYYDYSSISESTWCDSRKCRQVIIKIWPQSGHNLTRVEFWRKHSQSMLISGYSQPWLEVRMAGQYVQHISFYNSSTGNGPYCSHLEIFEFVGSNQITNLNYVFYNCSSLRRIVRFDTSNVTSMYRTFYNCYSLAEFPPFNFSNVVSLAESFYNCFALHEVPDLDLPACTSLLSSFYSCWSLYKVGRINAPQCSVAQSTFMYCYSLRRVEGLVLKDGVSIYGLFRECYALVHIPKLDFNIHGDISGTFVGCYFLQIVDIKGLLSYQYNYYPEPFNSCRSLSWVRLPGIVRSFSVSGNRLSREAIVRLFNDLGDVSSSQTVNVSGNWGVSYLTQGDIAIATGKGWTVVT